MKSMVKYSYNDVADWFLVKGKGKISSKKLQKLVYYAYAWVLTLLNDSSEELNIRLFDDAKFEAWVHGPVLRNLYAEYASYGFENIEEPKEQPEFVDDIQDILEQVWEVYGSYSGNQLESMTQQEVPWKNAHKDLSSLDSNSNSINDRDIFNFYKDLNKC